MTSDYYILDEINKTQAINCANCEYPDEGIQHVDIRDWEVEATLCEVPCYIAMTDEEAMSNLLRRDPDSFSLGEDDEADSNS